MLALFSRILKLSGKYKGRIQGAFVCAFLESILAKMPIFLAFLVLSGFYQKTLTGTKMSVYRYRPYCCCGCTGGCPLSL